MEIRQVAVSDAASVLRLMHQLDIETRFMMLEPDERTTSLAQQRDILSSFVSEQNKAMFVLCEEGCAYGYVAGVGNSANRNKHSMYCVIGIQQSLAGQGFGKKLLKRLEAWAINHGFSRMELTVMCHNQRAKRLYDSCGFEVEGVKRQSLLVDGQFVDEFYMSKLLSPEYGESKDC